MMATLSGSGSRAAAVRTHVALAGYSLLLGVRALVLLAASVAVGWALWSAVSTGAWSFGPSASAAAVLVCASLLMSAVASAWGRRLHRVCR